ncbi:MAG: LytTR family transcriptional regulator [Clostridia bacterium]|nr:LytTR family transcriptional regulator [Clostridia bacterium]
MKLFLDIAEKYKETEIHICSDDPIRASGLQKTLENILLEKISVRKNQESRSLLPYSIVRIYSENKRVYVRTWDDTFEVRERLYVLETDLHDQGFVRISGSELVNIALIEKLDMSYAGTIKMYMNNGDQTYVSRRYVSRIKEVLLRGDTRA